ncbi:hypothetical protein CCACVL1_03817, partial [Corchorus capsularis]
MAVSLERDTFAISLTFAIELWRASCFAVHLSHLCFVLSLRNSFFSPNSISCCSSVLQLHLNDLATHQ